MKAVVAAFNQEKFLVGAFSVITNLRMELFEALISCRHFQERELSGWQSGLGGEEARVSDVISNKAYIDLVNTSQPTITIPRALRLLPRHYSQTNIWNNAEHTSSPT